MGLGALLSLLFCGMYFCSLQAAEDVAKCQKSTSDLCGFFEVLIQKEGMGPLGLLYLNVRGSP